MLILHLRTDILHGVVWSFQSHWVTQFKEIVFIIKLIYSHKFTIFYWCTLAFSYPPKNANFSWTFHAPPDPIQCQRMKMSFLPSKTPIFDMLTMFDIDWGPGIQVYKKHCPYPRGPLTKMFCTYFSYDCFNEMDKKNFFQYFLKYFLKNIFWKKIFFPKIFFSKNIFFQKIFFSKKTFFRILE